MQVEFINKHIEDGLRQVGVVLQPHRSPHTPVADALFDTRQQIFGSAERQGRVRVSRHPDGMTRQDLIAVIRAGQVQPHHIFEQDKDMLAGRSRQRNKALDDLAGNMDNGQFGLGQTRGPGRAQGCDQTEGAIAEVGKGVAGINRQRRDNREQGPPKEVFQKMTLFGIQLFRTGNMNPLGFQLRLNGLQKTPVLFLGKLMDAL